MPNPIITPAPYTPTVALSYADSSSEAQVVSNINPLPVAPVVINKPLPLAGSVGTSATIGPFTPLLKEPIFLVLEGTWTGTVTVLRSIDGGATKRGLTAMGRTWAQFTANVCEPIWEEVESGATFYIDAVLASGTLTYRMGQ